MDNRKVLIDAILRLLALAEAFLAGKEGTA